MLNVRVMLRRVFCECFIHLEFFDIFFAIIDLIDYKFSKNVTSINSFSLIKLFDESLQYS